MEDYSGSKVLMTLRAFLGAVIGALPGVALWVILGKLGFIASFSGMAIAIGVVVLADFFTGGSDLIPPLALTIICTGVFITAILMSEKIVWTWEISDALNTYLSTFREEIIKSVMAENPDTSREEVSGILTDDVYNEIVTETFGVKEATFSECFSNFGSLLEKLEMKGKYIWSLVKSILFGMLGGYALLAKIK